MNRELNDEMIKISYLKYTSIAHKKFILNKGEKMKSLFTLIALGSVSLVSAGQYYNSYGSGPSDCPTCSYGGGNYQGQFRRGGYYYQPEQYQSQRGYYQRDDRNYPRYEQYDYQQQAPRYQDSDQDQQYYQQQPSRYQEFDQNRQYSQQQGSRYQENDQSQQYYQQQGNGSSYGNQKGYYDNNAMHDKDDSQRPLSDMEVKKKIEEKLGSTWFSKGFQNVTFDINHGNVSLRGSVDSLENKNKVEDSIKKIDGVRSVHSEITVTKENSKDSDAYSESDLRDLEMRYPQDAASSPHDRQLNARIRDKLSSWFSKGNEALIIRSANGVVIIAGPVDKVEDIQKTIERVKEVEGVKSVKSQLTVKNR